MSILAESPSRWLPLFRHTTGRGLRDLPACISNGGTDGDPQASAGACHLDCAQGPGSAFGVGAALTVAQAAPIAAPGASNTYGKGVSRRVYFSHTTRRPAFTSRSLPG